MCGGLSTICVPRSVDPLHAYLMGMAIDENNGNAAMDVAQLRASAKFNVGDEVRTRGRTLWRLTAHYLSAKTGKIVYDLLFEYNKVEMQGVSEEGLTASSPRVGP